jgi:cell division protein FtsL
MDETKETKVSKKGTAIALGIVCVILSACLAGVTVTYTFLINEKNRTISSLDTQIFELNSNATNLRKQIASDDSTINSLTSNVTNLQGQLDSILSESTFLLNIVTSDPSAWVNRTVVVEGVISRFLPPGFWWPPWNYELNSSGTTIGVSWNGIFLNGENVTVLGVVTGGRCNEMLANGTFTSYGPVYFIEAERINVVK